MLDTHGNHVMIYAYGPIWIARHNHFADFYADIIEKVGNITRKKMMVPEVTF